jgi:hypothetical protein
VQLQQAVQRQQQQGLAQGHQGQQVYGEGWATPCPDAWKCVRASQAMWARPGAASRASSQGA